MKKVDTNLIKKVEHLAAITISSLQLGKKARTQRCLVVTEKLLKKGNAAVRNAIINGYPHSVSHYLEPNRYPVSRMLPVLLRKEYIKQINTSGL